MLKKATLSFRDSDQLVAALKGRAWEEDLAALHEKEPDLGPLTAVYASVGKSTYRPFRKCKDWTPSIVFRSWASKELLDGALMEFVGIRSTEQYRGWATRLTRRLAKEWKKRLRYSLDTPRALKLVNLLAKRLCVVYPLWPEKYQAVIYFLEAPLDKYSLRPLACVPELAHLNINWQTASMGSVKDVGTYSKIQNAIQEICGRAGVPPVAYDFLVWDSPHREGEE